MARRLVGPFLMAGLLLLAVGPAAAQTPQTGLIQGRVVDSTGAPVPGAEIKSAQADGAYPRQTVADARGQFRINFVPPGRYTVTARSIGFRPATVTGVAVTAAQVTDLTITMARAVLELQAITVEASPVEVDGTRTEFSSTLGARERESLPTARTVNELLNLVPGARVNQVYGGSTDQANLYMLDGVTVNQPGRGGSFLLPNIDWVESFEVKGLGAGAEYGNFQGGLINVVTKSGTNTWQASLRTFFEGAGLNASNLNVQEVGSELDSRWEVNGDVRGPLVKDKLFLYLSGYESGADTRVVDVRTPDQLVFLPTQQTRREQKYMAKLTWQASTKDVVNAMAGIDNVFRERVGLRGWDEPDATYQGDSPSFFYNASWQRTFSGSHFLELKLSGYDGRDDELPYNGSDVAAINILDNVNNPQFRNSFYTRKNAPSSLGLNVNYDFFGRLGATQHHFKLGADATLGHWDENRTRNGDITWYGGPSANFDPLNPATWGDLGGLYATSDWGGLIDLDAKTRNSAIWLQDYMQVSRRLALNAGLRVSQWTGKLTPGNAGGTATRGEFTAVEDAGIDPRVGVTFDLTGKEDFYAKAHWGRYHQNLFAFMFDRAPGGNVFTNIEYWDWANTDKTFLPDLNKRYTLQERDQYFVFFDDVNLFNEANAIVDYQQPYVDQFVLGLEKSFGRRYKAELVYVNRVNRDIVALVDRNLATNYSIVRDVGVIRRSDGQPNLDQDGRPLVIPEVYVRNDDLAARLRRGETIPGYTPADIPRLTFQQDNVLTNEPDATRTFNQVQASFTAAYERWFLNAALVYTDLRGNFYTVSGYDQANGQGSGAYVDPNLQLNFDGRLPNYSPWEFKLRANGDLPWKFRGGTFLAILSGDTYTPSYTISTRQNNFTVGGTAVNRNLFSNVNGQAIFLEQRGSRQYDALARLDVRLERDFPIAGRALVAGIEVFNLFNAGTVTTVNSSVNNQDPADPTTLFGATRLRMAPRTIRLNAQFRY